VVVRLLIVLGVIVHVERVRAGRVLVRVALPVAVVIVLVLVFEAVRVVVHVPMLVVVPLGAVLVHMVVAKIPRGRALESRRAAGGRSRVA
jgi:hypothetical protein